MKEFIKIAQENGMIREAANPIDLLVERLEKVTGPNKPIAEQLITEALMYKRDPATGRKNLLNRWKGPWAEVIMEYLPAIEKEVSPTLTAFNQLMSDLQKEIKKGGTEAVPFQQAYNFLATFNKDQVEKSDMVTLRDTLLGAKQLNFSKPIVSRINALFQPKTASEKNVTKKEAGFWDMFVSNRVSADPVKDLIIELGKVTGPQQPFAKQMAREAVRFRKDPAKARDFLLTRWKGLFKDIIDKTLPKDVSAQGANVLLDQLIVQMDEGVKAGGTSKPMYAKVKGVLTGIKNTFKNELQTAKPGDLKKSLLNNDKINWFGPAVDEINRIFKSAAVKIDEKNVQVGFTDKDIKMIADKIFPKSAWKEVRKTGWLGVIARFTRWYVKARDAKVPNLLQMSEAISKELVRRAALPPGNPQVSSALAKSMEIKIKEMLPGKTASTKDEGRAMVEQAHPETAKLDVETKTDGNVVENIFEQQEKDMAVLLAPPKAAYARLRSLRDAYHKLGQKATANTINKVLMSKNASQMTNRLTKLADYADEKGNVKLADYLDDTIKVMAANGYLEAFNKAFNEAYRMYLPIRNAKEDDLARPELDGFKQFVNQSDFSPALAKNLLKVVKDFKTDFARNVLTEALNDVIRQFPVSTPPVVKEPAPTNAPGKAIKMEPEVVSVPTEQKDPKALKRVRWAKLFTQALDKINPEFVEGHFERLTTNDGLKGTKRYWDMIKAVREVLGNDPEQTLSRFVELVNKRGMQPPLEMPIPPPPKAPDEAILKTVTDGVNYLMGRIKDKSISPSDLKKAVIANYSLNYDQYRANLDRLVADLNK